jgi:hypothetical protein
MKILCDTSSILMLIQIVPDMFLNEPFECCTITYARGEIYRTQKFKEKYPWRDQFKDKIRCLPIDLVENEKVSSYFDVIKSLVDNGTINEKTGHDFDLSYPDMKFLSCTLGNGYRITTGDHNLRTFAIQEFTEEFEGWISPLGMLNAWLRKGIIEWNDKCHKYLEDWKRNNEDPQPKRQRFEFKKLTGRNYPGS